MVQVAASDGIYYRIWNCNHVENMNGQAVVSVCDFKEVGEQFWNKWEGLAINNITYPSSYYYNNDEITANEFVRIFKQELAISEYKSIPSEAKVLVAVRENDTCYLRHCNDAQLIDGEVFLNFFYDEIINYDTYCFLGFLHLHAGLGGISYNYRHSRITAEEFVRIFNEQLEESKQSILNRKQLETERKHESNVNHPSHYGGDNPLEVINVIEHYELGFHLGNVVKYVLLAGKKGSRKEDLEKALWYLQREIKKGGENG